MRRSSVPATAVPEKDLALLDSFLETFPNTLRGLRVPPYPWLDDAVYERLKAANLALCVADSEN